MAQRERRDECERERDLQRVRLAASMRGSSSRQHKRDNRRRDERRSLRRLRGLRSTRSASPARGARGEPAAKSCEQQETRRAPRPPHTADGSRTAGTSLDERHLDEHEREAERRESKRRCASALAATRPCLAALRAAGAQSGSRISGTLGATRLHQRRDQHRVTPFQQRQPARSFSRSSSGKRAPLEEMEKDRAGRRSPARSSNL